MKLKKKKAPGAAGKSRLESLHLAACGIQHAYQYPDFRKCGPEQRVDRVGCFEAVLLELERKGSVRIEHVPAMEMTERKMALDAHCIHVLHKAAFTLRPCGTGR